MVLRAVFLVVASVLVSSCGPAIRTDVTALSNQASDRGPTEEVRLFTDRSRVDREYQELALITVDDRGAGKDDADLVAAIVEEARRLGADAVILGKRSTESGGGVLVYNTVVPFTTTSFEAIAIVFTD